MDQDERLLELIGQRRVLFFGGKGGVGKTTLASAAALALARRGADVLVVSTDPAHNLGHVWDVRVGTEHTPLWRAPDGGPGRVTGLEIDADAVAREHLRTVESTVRGMMPEHLHAEVRRYFRLAEVSPGTHEAALLERMCQVVLESLESHDVVVFDTAPTGHTARLLALPEMMGTWTAGLLKRREQSERFADAITGLSRPSEDRDATTRAVLGDAPPPSRRGGSSRNNRDADIRHVLEHRRGLFEQMRAVLTDPARCAFFIVLVGERMPVLESQALHRQLVESHVDVGALLVNRRSPLDAGPTLAARAAAEADQVAHLRRLIPKVPVIEVPQVAGDPSGEAGLAAVADLL